MKFIACALQWVIILAILPGIKVLIDAGVPLLQAQGVDAATVAWVGVLPWLIPLAWFVGTIIWIVSPSKPKIPQYPSAPSTLFK
jgi:hypothetical protein